MGALMIVLLLGAFAFTAFRYFTIALSTGIMDLGYLIAIWILLILSSRLSATAAYALSCILGVLLLFPISLFIHVSENGNVGLTDGEAFTTMIGNPKVIVGIIVHVAVALAAQLAIRTLWRPRVENGLATD
jgi:hypothetical protein